ncbi:MAG TPA: hypothetical protein ENI23_08455 [bacterium]|nr:hypothetical protein [bacterium]
MKHCTCSKVNCPIHGPTTKKEIEEFTTTYEDVTFCVPKDRKEVFIVGLQADGREAKLKLSSGSMFMLCESIVSLFEDEEEAFDYIGRSVLIK